MRSLVALFQSRNYRLYFFGQFISQIGSWMTQTATLWLAYRLTESVFVVGLVGFATQSPTLLLAPLAGVWVDRLDRIRLLTVTQILAALQSLALMVCVLTDTATIPALLALAVAQGVINAFDIPARQALNSMLAERREDLSSIISLNSSLVNLGRMAGPTLAGFVIAAWGVGFCFALDALSYLAAIVSVLALQLRPTATTHQRSSVRQEFREGLALALHHRQIRVLFLVAAAVSVFGLSVFTLLPACAKEIFGGDGKTLGLLMSAFSAGAAVSGVVLAGRSDRGDTGQLIIRGLLGAGGSLLVFAFSKSLVLSVVALFVMGVGCVMVVASSNTLVQHLVEEDKRGRVMSLWGLAFQGGMPVGALITGSLTEFFGLSWMSVLNGVACLALTCFLLAPLGQLDEQRPAGLEPLRWIARLRQR